MWFYVLVLTLACLDSVRSCTEETLKNHPESTCYECPAGFHKEKGTSKCIKCIAGKEFTAIRNYDVACKRCKACDEGVSQMVVKSCEPKNDTECGCMKNYYPKKSKHRLQCIKCQTKDCSNYTECHTSCTITTTQRPPTLTPNPSITQTGPDHYPLLTTSYVFVVVLMTTLLIAGLLVLTKGGWMVHGCCATPEKDLQLPTRDTSANGQPNGPTSLTLNITQGIPMTTFSHSATKTEYHTLVTPLLPGREPRIPRQETQEERWPAKVLYAIIKEVPLRRWKEFLRLLSVPDQHLERVDLEPGLGSMERQYQMLRLWSQGPAAGLEDIYSALLYMDLAGCAHQLQDSLEQLQALQSISPTNDITAENHRVWRLT
ncbi:tumor necrosis factor receptor superfamily member 1A isoform X1 [Salmo salar]|uniref:Tumor necrosis factor receptor superfamily member 1A isoform X1 n=1 Tax=Salmo salar TaxID=8030 RepID=A0A1S3MEC6_SALSA|nr:tumor necrosis factor receptor superfamily member 1A-like isoform X1 [Salmo salar]|eukprot:XP_014001532.1 PREDICTED: tumor necrosis factor receptor superfamily member 1A-like [Salmo salar]